MVIIIHPLVLIVIFHSPYFYTKCPKLPHLQSKKTFTTLINFRGHFYCLAPIVHSFLTSSNSGFFSIILSITESIYFCNWLLTCSCEDRFFFSSSISDSTVCLSWNSKGWQDQINKAFSQVPIIYFIITRHRERGGWARKIKNKWLWFQKVQYPWSDEIIWNILIKVVVFTCRELSRNSSAKLFSLNSYFDCSKGPFFICSSKPNSIFKIFEDNSLPIWRGEMTTLTDIMKINTPSPCF